MQNICNGILEALILKNKILNINAFLEYYSKKKKKKKKKKPNTIILFSSKHNILNGRNK